MNRILGPMLASAVASGCAGDCEPAVYGGKASDEAWMSVRDALANAQVDEAKAPTVTSPESGAQFSDGARPTEFAWTSPLSARRDVQPWSPSKRGFSPWSLIIGTAEAHLPAVTGEVFLLEVGKQAETCPYLVLTTDNAFSTDDGLKTRLSTGGTFTATVTSVYLQDNRVTEGPYRSAKASDFTIGR